MKRVKKIKNEINGYKFLLRPFLVLCIIYLLGVSAILLAGVHFADDVGRTNYGYSGWNGFSRYTNTIVSVGLHADEYLTNIAPLPQLLSIVILSVASLCMICLISSREIFKKPFCEWIWYIVAVIPLGLSPYMLECLSYQYDAPYMALSVFAAIFPLLFSKKKWWIYGLSILIGMMITCTTYQVAVGIFPMMVVLLAIKEWNGNERDEKKAIVKFLVFSAAFCLIALLVFQQVLMKPRDVYVSNELPGIESLFGLTVEHLKIYYQLVLNDFKILWIVLLVLMVVSFEFLFIYRSKRNKILAGLIGAIGIVAMALFAFLFYAILEKPLYATRAMFSFGAFIAIIGVCIITIKEKMVILNVPVMILAWCFFVFSFTYGNALKEQNDYRNRVVDMVISDLNRLPLITKNDGIMKKIQVRGNLGYSPVILHMVQNNIILQRLLSPSFSEYVPWMAYEVVNESGLYNLYFDESIDVNGMNLPVLEDTVLYRICGDKENILVEFKDTRKFEILF